MQIDTNLSTPRMTIRNCLKSDLPNLTAMWFDEVTEALALVLEVFMRFEAPDYEPEGVGNV